MLLCMRETPLTTILGVLTTGATVFSPVLFLFFAYAFHAGEEKQEETWTSKITSRDSETQKPQPKRFSEYTESSNGNLYL